MRLESLENLRDNPIVRHLSTYFKLRSYDSNKVPFCHRYLTILSLTNTAVLGMLEPTVFLIAF